MEDLDNIGDAELGCGIKTRLIKWQDIKEWQEAQIIKSVKKDLE